MSRSPRPRVPVLFGTPSSVLETPRGIRLQRPRGIDSEVSDSVSATNHRRSWTLNRMKTVAAPVTIDTLATPIEDSASRRTPIP